MNDAAPLLPTPPLPPELDPDETEVVPSPGEAPIDLQSTGPEWLQQPGGLQQVTVDQAIQAVVDTSVTHELDIS